MEFGVRRSYNAQQNVQKHLKTQGNILRSNRAVFARPFCSAHTSIFNIRNKSITQGIIIVKVFEVFEMYTYCRSKH